MTENALSPAEREEIFSSVILPAFTSLLSPQSAPHAHILGGQPGAGKSHFIRILMSKNHVASIINGDDLRGYHPLYYDFLQKDELNAADMTQQDVNEWVERLIREIALQRGDMIIEGTMRKPEVPIKTAALLHEQGYTVSAHIILTHPSVSMVDTLLRYELQKKITGSARYTKLTAHEEAAARLYDSIMVLSQSEHIDRLALYQRRTVEYALLYEHAATMTDGIAGHSLRNVLQTEKNRSLTHEECAYITDAWEKIEALAKARHAEGDYMQELRAHRTMADHCDCEIR